jgi:hypothetical protein
MQTREMPKPELNFDEKKSLRRMLEAYQAAVVALQNELDLLASQKQNLFDDQPNQWRRDRDGAAMLQLIERLRDWAEQLDPDIPEIDLKAL